MERFIAIGLPEQRAKETVKNKKLSQLLFQVLEYAQIEAGCDKSIGTLLYTLASTMHKDALVHVAFLTGEIMNGHLTTTEQIAAAIEYARDYKEVDKETFEVACGVGVVVTDDQVAQSITQLLDANQETLMATRYKNLGPMLAKAKQIPAIRWASTATIKNEVEKQFLTRLGPKDERDTAKPKKEKPVAVTVTAEKKQDLDAIFYEGELARLHKPGGNKQLHPHLMDQHLKETGGIVVTRFPPEPNGYLHIGHAKAININFGYAKAHNGVCYLRYDDTNPEAEEEIYFTMIKDAVEWLGFTPHKITYSSDYFHRLYECAVELIKRDKAYVCHCTGEEIHAHRGGDAKGPRTPCSHRDRPIEESLVEFTRMRDGHYNEGEAILRMKMNLDDGNPQFWDLVAYRILKTEHHRTADEWIVYPTYDFTHCLVDSFENITHSLCTVEFRQSRESYYWLVDALEVYKPVQWEYGRLSVTNTVLSKRKLKQLVDKGLVDGWDDPRLYTLSAIRRRGVPPQAVNAFVREVGVTTADSTIEVIRLDGHIRNVLNDAAPRLIAILDPVRVRITNLPDDYCEMVSVPWHPKNTDMGTHQLPFTNTLYIERSDFRKVDEAGYFRLAPGKSVGLLYLKHPLECTAYAKDDQGNVTSIDCVYRTDSTVKPKTHIHWLAQHDVVLTVANEVRIYGNLFHHLNPQDKSQVPDGYLSDVNPDSLHTIHNTALIESGFDTYYKAYLDGTTLPHDTRFQFVRTGYFCLDKDTATNKVVFNRIVSLKEDSNKT